MASSAGDRASFIRAARDWGVLSLGYFSLDKQREVTRCPQGAKAFDLDVALDFDAYIAVSQQTQPPGNGGSRSALQQSPDRVTPVGG
jgi:hypothetical protein